MEEEEEEAFYIRVPSPTGLIGWDIQRHLLHVRCGNAPRGIVAMGEIGFVANTPKVHTFPMSQTPM